MKKEYLILIALIIGLSAFLMLKKDNRINYELPMLSAVEAETVDQIRITQKEETFDLSKEKDTWILTDKAYLADKAAVREMLDTISNLTLSALVSETSDLIRYDLDEENRIQVQAMSKGKVLREFFVGKPAPSFNHTFVMLEGDSRVFQADKSFRNDFNKSVDDLRDKVVLSFKTPEIKALTLSKDSKTLRLVKKVNKTEDQKESDSAEEETWLSPDGKPADKTAVQDLLASLSRLECQNYKSETGAAALKKETPTCKISLENNEHLSLNLFEGNEGEAVAGTSSASAYAFDLASYKAQDIITYIDTLLGIEKEKEKTSDKD